MAREQRRAGLPRRDTAAFHHATAGGWRPIVVRYSAPVGPLECRERLRCARRNGVRVPPLDALSSERDADHEQAMVSLVMPAWRPRADWLVAAVRSALAQIGPPIELIVVDDGSAKP